MRTTLKLPLLHEHRLILRKLSKDILFSCRLCDGGRFPKPGHFPQEIDNFAYCCEDCDYFVHKWCGEAPQIIQHPSHPQHQLAIDYKGFMYRCRESEYQEYNLNAKVAIATLPPDPEDEEKKNHDPQLLDHFAHNHPLTLFRVTIPSKINCDLCENKILVGPVYGCRACLFLLHESCARLPQQMEHHPLHPQHNLKFGYINRDISCAICAPSNSSFMCLPKYCCCECDFRLHVKCAVSSLSPPLEPVKLQHLSHEHQLTSCYLKGGHHGISCQICQSLIKCGEVYCCTKKKDGDQIRRRFCDFFVHKDCAELPEEMIHPFHPNHALNLISGYDQKEKEDSLQCHACGSYISSPEYMFDCGICDFSIHLKCASETLHLGVAAKLQHFANPNLLLNLGFTSDDDPTFCNACWQHSVQGLAYFDVEKHETFHISCASENKPVLEHPFHPQHPLVLYSRESIKKSLYCNGCHSKCKFYYYSCACGFNLDTNCVVRKPTLKDPCHKHDLAYFEKANYLRCEACGYSCGIDLYRCVECNFNIHRDCLPLPPVVEDQKCHRHPIKLRDNGVVQDCDEQHCDVCKGMRNPRHGVYYCEECPFAAHIECVISKEPKRVKPKHSQTLKKNIVWAKSAVKNFQKRLHRRLKNLEALESIEGYNWGQTQVFPKVELLLTKGVNIDDGSCSSESLTDTDE